TGSDLRLRRVTTGYECRSLRLTNDPGTGCIQQTFAHLHCDRSWAFGEVNRKPAAAGSSDAKINGVIARPVLAPRRRPDSERIRPVLFQFRWGNDLRVAIGERSEERR